MGAFKIRGGLTYFEGLRQRGELPLEVITATRGNHGQSVGWAARAHNVQSTIVVPLCNSQEKNRAMRALGSEVLEVGEDFQASREYAMHLATLRQAHLVPSFHPDLLLGVSTYWWEFFKAVPALEVVYVPIGLGSGICSAILAKEALGHSVHIVGVVSDLAPTYADSLEAGRVVERAVSTQIADGMAVRIADTGALERITGKISHIVRVSDAEVRAAMRAIYHDTHNVAEGAGAASFAAAMQERDQLEGKIVGTTLCGGNVDARVFAEVLLELD